MRISDLFYETWLALRSNKGRSLLTILGIVIGIASVISMTSLIGGVKDALINQLGLNQSRTVYIGMWGLEGVTDESLREIADGVDGYEFVAGATVGAATATTGTKKADVGVRGVTDGYFKALGYKLKSGRFFSSSEVAGDGMIVVLDESVVRSLYGADAEDPVGESVTIGNDSYEIIGVIESQGSVGSQGETFVPYQTGVIRITGDPTITDMVGFAQEGTDMKQISEDTESFLLERYNLSKEDNMVYVMSVESIQQEMSSTVLMFQALMSAVASISLLVGGIGIMNMMLTNVTERIREIGLRKALGAHRSDITKQFLFESVSLCLVGGVIGFLLGYGSAFLLSLLLSGVMGQMFVGQDMSITPSVSLETVLLSIGICAGIGIVFGFWPAHRATKLDPVESLRYQ
ncbi:MAG: ABC transporter permease [Eggerthellaceae bacterium]|nr:ABC transporter permease [Eggerthellaceae bacterium]